MTVSGRSARDPEVPEPWSLLRQAMTISLFAVFLWLVVVHDPTARWRNGDLDDRYIFARSMVEVAERQALFVGGAFVLAILAGVLVSLRCRRGGFRDVLSSVSILTGWTALTGFSVFVMAVTTYGANAGDAWFWVVWVWFFQALFLIAGAALPDGKIKKLREKRIRDEAKRALDASAEQTVIRDRAVYSSLRNLMVTGIVAPLVWLVFVHFGFFDQRAMGFSGAGGGPMMLKMLRFAQAHTGTILWSVAGAATVLCIWGLRTRGLLRGSTLGVAAAVKLFWMAVVAGCVLAYACLVVGSDPVVGFLSGVLVLMIDVPFTAVWAWNGLKSETIPH